MVESPGESSPLSGSMPREPARLMRMGEISDDSEKRISTGIHEFDRVLGGGLVQGSLVLVGGDPGIGKSTLLMQAAGNLSKSLQVLYVSGEESASQVAMRARRIGAGDGNTMVLCHTDVSQILDKASEVKPDIIIIDSIQTIFSGSLQSAPGSVAQIRECAAAFMRYAKSTGAGILLVGHVTKSGAIAGPMVLEHMVDTVLYFEGNLGMGHRVLRAVKNRFGSTNEIGIFTMGQQGMKEVANPSEMLLEQRPRDASGSCVTATMEGSRPILAEVQALVCRTTFGNARRQASGIDFGRVVLLLAVLEKRAGITFYDQDVYVNAAGGLRLAEPAVDLALAMAAASGAKNIAIPADIAVFGEVGLAGEVRSVSEIERRLAEVRRAGFSGVIMPHMKLSKAEIPEGLEIMQVKTIAQAIDKLF